MRLKLAVILIFLMLIGFATKMHAGVFQTWINNSLGGIIYVIFFMHLALFVNLKWKPLHIALMVFVFTSLIEFTQLINGHVLNIIRKYFIGRTLIGTTFNPFDFFYYLIGAIFGYFSLVFLIRINNKQD